jgi:hypothetical protein
MYSSLAAGHAAAHRDAARGGQFSCRPTGRMKLWGARGTESLQTPRWREMDSNFRYRGTKAATFADLADSAGPLRHATHVVARDRPPGSVKLRSNALPK